MDSVFLFFNPRFNKIRKGVIFFMKITQQILDDDSPLIMSWMSDMTDTMMKINPEWCEQDIKEELGEMLKEQGQIPVVNMDNNYTGENRDSNLLSVLDWMLENKPIIAGNGTFYKNHNQEINPIATMLDGFLASRKKTKKEMFKVEDKTSDRYFDLDRKQLNYKILANSYYGGSGMPASAFYSKWSGPATTGTAQSVISSTKTFFESFLVNNYKFIDINEAFHYMNKVIGQDYKLPKYIIPETKDNLFLHIKEMFLQDVYKDEYEEILRLYINNLTEEEVTKIFYKNNLIEFIRRHDEIKDVFNELFESVHNYEYADSVTDIPIVLADKFSGDDEEMVKQYNQFVNHEYFMDPNSPPDNLIEYLNALKDLIMTCVYMPFMSVDRIHRLKYFQRKTVVIVDKLKLSTLNLSNCGEIFTYVKHVVIHAC